MAMHTTKKMGLAPKLMTEVEFDNWCDEDTRAEYKDGEVTVASPASVRHERVGMFLQNVLSIFVTRKDLGEVLGSQVMVRLRSGLRRVPDLIFIAKAHANLITTNLVDGAPDLIVEIVSPDSVARDWRDKYLEYADAGVREYWVIDPQSQRMEWYALNEKHQYEPIEPEDGVWHSRVLAGLDLRDGWLWQETLPDAIEIVRQLGVSV